MSFNFASLANKKILLGVTGSIAAYKSAELIRLLIQHGASVRVVMSAGANAFITPMTLQTLSGHRVLQSSLDNENEAFISHIELARWADLILIAPATAHCIAKLSVGFADDMLSTLCLASRAPIMIAPAMNTVMWQHVTTQNNIELLTQRGVLLLHPEQGSQACGEIGEGRMMEPETIVHHIEQFFSFVPVLKNYRLLITAGPTQEALDPVRYIGNYSSGKMGYAIAAAAAQAGAHVTLISGPTSLACPPNVKRLDVISTIQMHDAVMSHIAEQDIFIATAAVSDYRAAAIATQKIKKSSSELHLTLTKNPDILLAVANLQKRPFIVGFAAETENLIANAQKKLQEKKLDMIVANQVGHGLGFQSDENELQILTADQSLPLNRATKKELAYKLINMITEKLARKVMSTDTIAHSSLPN